MSILSRSLKNKNIFWCNLPLISGLKEESEGEMEVRIYEFIHLFFLCIS